MNSRVPPSFRVARAVITVLVVAAGALGSAAFVASPLPDRARTAGLDAMDAAGAFWDEVSPWK